MLYFVMQSDCDRIKKEFMWHEMNLFYYIYTQNMSPFRRWGCVIKIFRD